MIPYISNIIPYVKIQSKTFILYINVISKNLKFNTICQYQNINTVPKTANTIPYVKIQSTPYIKNINVISNTINTIPYIKIQSRTFIQNINVIPKKYKFNTMRQNPIKFIYSIYQCDIKKLKIQYHTSISKYQHNRPYILI